MTYFTTAKVSLFKGNPPFRCIIEMNNKQTTFKILSADDFGKEYSVSNINYFKKLKQIIL
jgi:hypothetical protein